VTETLLLEHLDTPLGEMMLVSDEAGRLRAADWTSHAARMHRLLQRHSPGFILAPGRAHGTAFAQYFAGDFGAIVDLPVFTRGTAFQHAVWQALRHVPAGRTISYAALASLAGQPSAVRAAGAANGANPLSIVVPCHRVIGSDGRLTGYGGGIERKSWLLSHERMASPTYEAEVFAP
jgi:methylated-DNA-[protein]-cysteine S-methyltransferase